MGTKSLSTCIWIAAASILLACISTTARAEGAVAFGITPKAVSIGIRVNLALSETAASQALSACRQNARERAQDVLCGVVSKFRRECAAYARGTNWAAWSVTKEKPDAENRALSECRAKSNGCNVVLSVCDLGEDDPDAIIGAIQAGSQR